MKSKRFSLNNADNATAEQIFKDFPTDWDMSKTFHKSYKKYLSAVKNRENTNDETAAELITVDVLQPKRSIISFVFKTVSIVGSMALVVLMFNGVIFFNNESDNIPDNIDKPPVVSEGERNNSAETQISTTTELISSATKSTETQTTKTTDKKVTETVGNITETREIEITSETVQMTETENEETVAITEPPQETENNIPETTQTAPPTEPSLPKEENKTVTFEELLAMADDELMKYCEDNSYSFTSQEQIRNELKSGGRFFIRMKPEQYLIDGIDDICVSENISDIKQYNAYEYDFDKMIAELNLPEKYFTVKVDDTPFMVCSELKFYENGDIKPYFLKLANLSVNVNPEFAESEELYRLYQLINILPQINSNFHSISVQYVNSISTGDESDTFPYGNCGQIRYY